MAAGSCWNPAQISVQKAPEDFFLRLHNDIVASFSCCSSKVSTESTYSPEDLKSDPASIFAKMPRSPGAAIQRHHGVAFKKNSSTRALETNSLHSNEFPTIDMMSARSGPASLPLATNRASIRRKSSKRT